MFENKSLTYISSKLHYEHRIFADENVSIILSYEILSSKSHSILRSSNAHKLSKQLPA